MPNTPQPIPLLADHPALDLLNTVPCVEGELVDLFKSDADVLRWLAQTGFSTAAQRAPSGLLKAAQSLRESIRRILEKRKDGQRPDLAALNMFLSKAQSAPQLAWDKSHTMTIKRVRPQNTPEELLAPLAESAADLLVTGDFDLIKRCEDESCVLWFYDRTKSHHRRWCSMATCGNRNKVAAYRKRSLERSV